MLWINCSYWLKRWAHGWIDCLCWNQKGTKREDEEREEKIRAGGTRLIQLLAHTLHTHITYSTAHIVKIVGARFFYVVVSIRYVWFAFKQVMLFSSFFHFYSFKLKNSFLSFFINILNIFLKYKSSVWLSSILQPCSNIPLCLWFTIPNTCMVQHKSIAIG